MSSALQQIRQAQSIYTGILDATKGFRGVQQEIINKMKSVSDCRHDKQPGDDNIVIDKCRRFAQERK